MEILKFIVIGLLGGLASVLTKRGVAVFHDGLRPIIPEYIEGRMDKKALMATSFALSFGLVIGFGIPASIAASTVASILLIHSVLLGTDIIGTWSPNTKLGDYIAFGVGALYGVLLLVGLGFIVSAFAMLPVNFLPALGEISTPIIVSFAVFPALVVAYQYGFKKGLIVLAIALVAKQIIIKIGAISILDMKIQLNADGMALLISMTLMLILAAREKAKVVEGQAGMSMLVGLFSERVKRIKSNWLLLALTGGIIAAATSMGMLAGDLISLNLLKDGIKPEAALTALAIAIGFIPLVGTTAITTGVYSPAGMKFVFVFGILIGNPIIAFVAGGLMIIAEIFFLERVAILLEKYPGIKACSDHIRTATTKVLEIALLVGGMIAAEKIAPKLGFFFVVGLYLINKTSKKPFVEMALGPIAAIALGIIVNVLYFLNLF
ncbi:MAG: YhfT family protein [Alphaproteobacteria bacterium]|nr:YhfT family protein [Alphaproteobacteria bacterium]